MGQGSSVRVAMVMAVPMTHEGGEEVKGHRLWRMVQLSPWRPRSLAAAKSYVHRKKGGEESRWGGISLHSERIRRRKTVSFWTCDLQA